MSGEDDGKKTIVVNKETLIPLGIVISICFAVLSLHVWLLGRFDGINEALSRIDHKLENVEKKVVDSWGASDMKIWELELQRRNPTMNIPDSWAIFSKKAVSEK